MPYAVTDDGDGFLDEWIVLGRRVDQREDQPGHALTCCGIEGCESDRFCEPAKLRRREIEHRLHQIEGQVIVKQPESGQSGERLCRRELANPGRAVEDDEFQSAPADERHLARHDGHELHVHVER